MKKVAAATLGCKVNQYDTDAILRIFRQSGYEIVDFDNFADIYIINTCTVTNTGDKKSRQMIRRARAKNGKAIVVATGCYSQVAPKEVARVEGVNIVTGARNREGILALVEEYSIQHEKSTRLDVQIENDEHKDEAYENLEIDGNTGRTRAFIKVQDGCDQFCSYCAVPYARGRARSRAPEDVIKEARRLAEAGHKEIVITGIHVASYGKDIGYENGLIGLLDMAHEIYGIERIRLSSIDPCFADERFTEAIGRLPKLCDHFHLSLQSGCDKILLAMNRKYTVADYMSAVERIRVARPDASLTTDVIIGFPGESDEDFKETLEFVSTIKPAMTHVFPYSPKNGTVAADLPGRISNPVKHIRTETMMELGSRLWQEFQSRFIGRTMDVLIENQVSGNIFQGHTTNYIPVVHESDKNITGEIVPVLINACNMPEFVL